MSLKIPHETSNTQLPAHVICSPKHFGYKPVSKIEVPEIEMDHSSTVRDLAQCSTYILVEHFILLNSRLNELSVESKNVRIGVRTRKLWPSKVDAADSQGCAEIWAHTVCHSARDFSIPKHIAQPRIVPKPRKIGL